MKKYLNLIVIIVLILFICVLGYIVWDSKQIKHIEPEEPVKEEVKAEEKVTVDELLEQSIDTEAITTNFADNGYGKMKFKLITASKEDAEEIKKLQFRIDSTIIHYINGLNKSDALGSKGISLIETNLQTELNKQLGEEYITKVYIVDMLIQ